MALVNPPGGCSTSARVILEGIVVALHFDLKILRKLSTGGVIQSREGVSGDA